MAKIQTVCAVILYCFLSSSCFQVQSSKAGTSLVNTLDQIQKKNKNSESLQDLERNHIKKLGKHY